MIRNEIFTFKHSARFFGWKANLRQFPHCGNSHWRSPRILLVGKPRRHTNLPGSIIAENKRNGPKNAKTDGKNSKMRVKSVHCGFSRQRRYPVPRLIVAASATLPANVHANDRFSANARVCQEHLLDFYIRYCNFEQIIVESEQ